MREIESFIPRLHYRVTFLVFFILGVVLGILHIATKSVQCNHFIEQTPLYCTSRGQYWARNAYQGSFRTHDRGLEYLSVNHFVFFRLMFMAIFFYLPRFVWQLWEGGKIQKIASYLILNSSNEAMSRRTVATTAEYIRRHNVAHTVDFAVFGICELLNFVNVVAQIVLLNRFLGNILWTHGLNVMSLTNEPLVSRNDTMLATFPRAVTCYFGQLTALGDVELKNALCTFPNNALNETVFTFVLIWLIVLSWMSFNAIVFRVFTFIPRTRRYILSWKFRHMPPNQLSRASRGAGDWFIIHSLNKTVDLHIMTEVVKDLSNLQRTDYQEEVELV